MAVMQPIRALRAVKPADAGHIPPLSPERSVLAGLIAEQAEVQAQRAGAERALDAAKRAEWEARSQVDAAPELIERAKANAARQMIETARSGTGGTSPTIREARDALADARDAMEVAQVSRAALQDEIERIDDGAWLRRQKIEEAARAVIRAEAADKAKEMAQDLIRLQREMLAAGQALGFLADCQAVPCVTTPGGAYGKPADDAVRQAGYRMQAPPFTWSGLVREWGDAAKPWRAAFAALQFDATAPLPTVATDLPA